MKSNFLLVFVLVASTVLVHAQGETRIGIKAGFTSANVWGKDVSQLSNNGSAALLHGFHVGLFVNSKIGRYFWIKSEVLTIQKGAVLRVADKWNQQYNSNFKSQYIDVYPLSPTFHFRGFQVFAGPYVSTLLSSSIQQKDSLGTMQSNTSIFGLPHQNAIYRRKLDVGIVIGLEYEFKSGITISGHYTRGFIPLFEDIASIVTNPSGPPPPEQKVYNKSLSLSLGYSFGGHRRKNAKS